MEYPNWFKLAAVDYFEFALKKRYAGKPLLDFLQIGAYKGDASVWMLDNILTDSTSWLSDVDTWSGSDEKIHKTMDWVSIEDIYDEQISNYPNVYKCKGYSEEFLKNAEKEHYDFIYVDGDHTADAVYSDAILSWDCLKQGGLMAFDDYMWSHDSGDKNLEPKKGIDKFIKQKKKDLKIMIMDEQVWVVKK